MVGVVRRRGLRRFRRHWFHLQEACMGKGLDVVWVENLEKGLR